MDKDYAKYLLTKTKEDYNLIADEFSRTRSFVRKEQKIYLKYVDNGDRVLDLGCGNGILAEILKGKNVDYVGVDNSEEFIGIAKNRYPGKIFKVADALNLPFSDNFFDKVLSLAVLHHIPSNEYRSQFLKEIHRVLKPQGKAVIAVWGLDIFNRAFYLFKYTFLKIIGRSKLDFKDIFVPWSNKTLRYVHCFSKAELISLARKDGFKVREVFSWKKSLKSLRSGITLVIEKK